MHQHSLVLTRSSSIRFNYKVHDDFNAELLRFSEKLLEILIRSENWIDLFKVRDVVTKVDLRRLQNWTQPCRCYSSLVQMSELRDNSFDVSDAIIVRVFERAWIDLVELRSLKSSTRYVTNSALILTIADCHQSDFLSACFPETFPLIISDLASANSAMNVATAQMKLLNRIAEKTSQNRTLLNVK